MGENHIFAFTDQPMLFATGLECSYPKVEHGRRRDELAETKHYECWRDDFRLCAEIGAKYLRYGIPTYRMHLGANRYDWSWTDEVLPALRDAGITPIIDLCHFGVPDFIGDFQNTDWPELFAAFAGAFAGRYSWVQYYTPVNEILVCARLSGREGLWNGQHKSDATFVRAIVNMCRATILAGKRILQNCPDAVFFQSEAAEVVHERWPETRREVDMRNQERFLSFDLLYGHPPNADMLQFLLDNGFTREDYDWFMHHGQINDPHCVMGSDYYAHNERYLTPDGQERPCGPVLGWHGIAGEYYGRYHKPMMLTETNTLDPDAGAQWLWRTWQSVQHLRSKGVPVLGFTWYSLIDQIDWDISIRAVRGHVNGNGLFTLERKPRPASEAFREVARRYSSEPVLPEQ